GETQGGSPASTPEVFIDPVPARVPLGCDRVFVLPEFGRMRLPFAEYHTRGAGDVSELVARDESHHSLRRPWVIEHRVKDDEVAVVAHEVRADRGKRPFGHNAHLHPLWDFGERGRPFLFHDLRE